jgi:hypothetical protein
MEPTSRLCRLSQPHRATCSSCLRWKFEGVKVRRSRWNAPVFKFKCDHGPHTYDFYHSTQVNYSSPIASEATDGDVETSDGGRKHRAVEPLVQNTPKRRAPSDCVEKDSNEFKV